MEEESSGVVKKMDKEVLVTAVSEGSSDFVRIKQEVDLPEDDTYYPMDFGISVEDEEEMNPVYVKMRSKEPGSSGINQGRDGAKPYEEEEDSEESGEESREESDEESPDSGERTGEEDGDQEWMDNRGIRDEEREHPSTSEPTSASFTADMTPVVIKDEPLSDDEGPGLSYEEDPDQFAESYKMLESLRRASEREEGGQSSRGALFDNNTNTFGEEDPFTERLEHFMTMPQDQGQFRYTDMMDTNLPHTMDGEEYLQQTMDTSSNSFTCDLCQKPCGNRTNYFVHLRIKHAEELPYECGICEERFSTEIILKDHIHSSHTGDEGDFFKCDVCAARFSEKQYLHAHMLSHNEYATFPCHICRKTFMKRKDLQKHLSSHAKTIRESIPCPMCNKVFRLPRNLAIHLRTHSATFICQLCSEKPQSQEVPTSDDHKDGLGRTSTPEENSTEQEEIPGDEQQLFCKVCNVTFTDQEDRVGHNCKVNRCSNCLKDFSCPSLLAADGESYSSEENPMCDTCNKAFSLMDKVKPDERASKVEKGTVQCRMCLKRFPKPILNYSKPISNHPKRNQPCATKEASNSPLRFPCRICGNIYFMKSTLRKHVKVHEREHIYLCEICDTIFHKKKTYRRHLKVHDEKRLKCPKCKVTFSKEKYLKKHLKNHLKKHLEKQLENEKHEQFYSERPTDSDPTVSSKKKLEKQEKCLICSWYFSSRKNLIEHQKCHLRAPGMFTCIDCWKSFPLKRMLTDHQKIHERQREQSMKHVCDICELSCVNELHLYNHKRIHAGMKIRVCDTCGKSFNSLYKLIEHQENSHSQCVCQVCGKGFLSTSELEVHHKDKHVEDPQICTTCDKVCVNQLHLKNHRLIHSGRKLCVCEFCGDGFSHRYKLVKHMEIHTGQKPHNCDICEEGFSQTADLLLHRKIHDEEHPGLVIGDDFVKKEDTTQNIE
ncbi:zinc finger protein 665 isoform X1 [Strongylocentrotus purpuratus]|uniref:C2H2-type domain-containing protein n=1 Tax=Strongylocentrotus purpuratus TaxID=7668 RepID=A0A7M7NYH0_STRPU|nr:zinc finger protein 665 isoform X1 [Strongylocentrotus purpuratus]